MCPILDRSGQSLDNAFTIVSESPSKMARRKPNSSMKIIALLAALASRISTVGGMTNYSAKDAITCPSSFLTTTPIHASSSFAKSWSQACLGILLKQILPRPISS
nr:hypothetical protein CFP56_26240 [Quercus suber]